MADDDKISSFTECGSLKGRCQLVFSDNLAQEAQKQDKYHASMPNGAEVTVGRALFTILQEAVMSQASCIHINAAKPVNQWRGEFRIRHRIGGKLWEVNAFPIQTYAAFCARLKIISGVNIAERRVPQFGGFLYEQSGVFYEMRLSSIPTQFGEAFAIHVLQIVGHGNYTEDRHEWLDKLTIEDIMAQINAKRQEKPE